MVNHPNRNKKKSQPFEGNEHFDNFRKALAERGVTMRLTLVSFDGTDQHMAFATFCGSGFQPAMLGGVVVDYGPGKGYALYTEKTHSIADDVKLIVGERRTLSAEQWRAARWLKDNGAGEFLQFASGQIKRIPKDGGGFLYETIIPLKAGAAYCGEDRDEAFRALPQAAEAA